MEQVVMPLHRSGDATPERRADYKAAPDGFLAVSNRLGVPALDSQ